MTIRRVTLRLRELMFEQESYDILFNCHRELFAFFNVHKFEKYLLDKSPSPMSELNLIIEVKDKLNELDIKKPLIRPNESGNHYGFELFYNCPFIREAPFFWTYMARNFSNDLLPLSQHELISKYLTLISELNIPFGKDESIYLEQFDHGEANKGIISGQIAEKGLDYLLARAKEFEYD